jgi:hydroxyacylglutathione hydrolase
MKVIPLKAFQDNYIWMVQNTSLRSCLVVDPGDADPVLQYTKNNHLDLQAILLTHHHFDHQGGVAELIASFPQVQVFGPRDERMPLVNYYLTEPDIFSLFSFQFKTLNIPGHTSSHIAYYEEKQEWLFCGDTLFSAGCGRVFDGTLLSLYQSLQKLATLPENTKVFCAHEYTTKNLEFALQVEPYNVQIRECLQKIMDNPGQCTLPSTIGKEQSINPFFRLPVLAAETTSQKLDRFNDPFQRFMHLRKLKDVF